jgi:hypothetical protein
MKNWILLSVAVCLLTGAAFAQAWDERTRIPVAYEFAVGDTVLPVGTYSVSTQIGGSGNRLMLTNTKSGASAIANTIDISIKGNTFAEKSKFVFKLDASGRHVLHQVWIRDDRHGHELLHK